MASIIEDWLRNHKKFSKSDGESSSVPLERTVGIMSEHFDCAICQSPLTTPMQTPCGHLFCSFCLEELCNPSSVPCPLCKSTISTRGLTKREDVDDVKNFVTKLCCNIQGEIQRFLKEQEKQGEGKSKATTSVTADEQQNINQRELTSVAIVEDWLKNNNRKCPSLDKDKETTLEKAMSYIMEHFDCTKCGRSLAEPMQTSCGHLYCNLCLKELLNAQPVLCPLCTKKISTKGLTERDDVKYLKNFVTNLGGAFDMEFRKFFKDNGNQNTMEDNSKENYKNQLQDQRQRYVLCPTRLDKAQMQKLQAVSRICNGTVSRDFTDEVTHLVINLSNGRVPQTLKYLLAIAGRKWVVIFDWVEQCIESGEMVPEIKFETSNFVHCDPGVKRSRLSQTNLFEGFYFYFSTEHYKRTLGFTMEEITTLMETLGAKVIRSPESFHGSLLIIGSPKENETEYYHWLHTEKWITITLEWILECILEYRLQPILKTHLCIDISRGDLKSANVPESLKETISRYVFQTVRTR